MDRIFEAFLRNLADRKVLSSRELGRLAEASTLQAVDRVLLEKGVPRAEILEAKAAALGGLEWVDLSGFAPEPEIARIIPKAMALRYGLVCIGKKDGKIVVAMSDPTDVFPAEYVSMRTGYDIHPVLALEEDLQRCIERAYQEPTSTKKGPASPTPGTGAREAVPEASLKQVGSGRFLTVDLSAAARPQPKPLAGLFSAFSELSATLETDRLLVKLLETVQQLCQAEESSVLLHDEILNVLYFKCASGEKGEELKKVILPMSEESIAGWVAIHREPLLVNNVGKDSRHYRGLDQLLQFKTRNLICVPILTGGKLCGVLEAVNKRGGGEFAREDQEYLEALARHAGVCLTNTILVDQLQNYFMSSVEILMAAVEALEPPFKGHLTLVARLASAMAKDLGMGGKAYETITYAALLHDLGKLKITPLPDQEIQRRHPILGAEMLNHVMLLRDVIPLIRMHHERFDGTGFPEGLSGDALPLGARILSLAEHYVEWVEEDTGRTADEFAEEEGQHHDPRVVGALQKVVRALRLPEIEGT